MATAALIHPIDARYETIEARLGVERGKLEREIQDEEHGIQRLTDALVHAWGSTDGDRRRIDDRPGFDLAEREYARARAVHRARISRARGLLEDLDARREMLRRRAREETVVGPRDVVVTMPAIPMEATDRRLSTLKTKRAAMAADLETVRARIDDLVPLVEEDREIAATLASRVRLGLVDAQAAAVAKA